MSFENESFENATETDSGEPAEAGKRSAFKVLESLAHRPLEQARKLEQYLVSADERKAKLVKKCTPAALKLVSDNCPGLIQ